MSDHVSYHGKPLGKIRLDDTRSKFVFVAEGLEALAQLFEISQDDKIEVEGIGTIPYRTFQEEHLKKISAFYPSDDEWLTRNLPEKEAKKVFRR